MDKNKSIFIILFELFLILLFCSCSASEPHVKKVYSSVVFDYKDNGIPVVRLVVFLCFQSDDRRIMSIKVRNEESLLEWNITEPERIKDTMNNTVWVGSSSLREGFGTVFPEGRYTIECVDFASLTTNSFFKLSFPANLKSMQYSDFVKSKEKALFTNSYFVLYNSEGKIISFGNDDIDNASILEQHPDASYKRIYHTASNNSYAVLTPAEILK